MKKGDKLLCKKSLVWNGSDKFSKDPMCEVIKGEHYEITGSKKDMATGSITSYYMTNIKTCEKTKFPHVHMCDLDEDKRVQFEIFLVSNPHYNIWNYFYTNVELRKFKLENIEKER